MYGTLAGFRSYASDRGNSAPADAEDAAASAALLRGDDYIRMNYVPRLSAGVTEEALEEASYIAAGLELTTPGFFSKTFTAGERKVLTGVGDIRWTVLPGAEDDAAPVSTLIRPSTAAASSTIV